MIRHIAGALAAALVVALVPLCVALGQTTAPGHEPYTPTRLEWAAMELQTLYGERTPYPARPIVVTFLPRNDGITVLCLIQYTSNYPEEALAFLKQGITRSFELYRSGRGWAWLRLQIQERAM